MTTKQSSAPAPATQGPTPGPWAVNETDSLVYRLNGGQITIAVTGPFEGLPVFANGGTRIANARIIAAAPELLAALERVLQHYEEAVILAGYEPEKSPSCEAARAALAKARSQG